MQKFIQNIVHGFVVLIVGAALMGVNVRQLYCSHSDHLLWEVCILPIAAECPCEEDCCGEKNCHDRTRCDFYKITDCSRIETGVQMEMDPFYFSESFFHVLWNFSVEWREFPVFRHEIPDRIMMREMLCTYLC